jgi:hypothetical protein
MKRDWLLRAAPAALTAVRFGSYSKLFYGAGQDAAQSRYKQTGLGGKMIRSLVLLQKWSCCCQL